jgi:hypothetical protein
MLAEDDVPGRSPRHTHRKVRDKQNVGPGPPGFGVESEVYRTTT